MAPIQRTFSLIPDAIGLPGLGAGGGAHLAQGVMSKPPMTTKQAKRAYNKANKGPKLSRAEQRRIELMEQDRIRKEFEKEKAQQRARSTRDRKKAKEEAQKEAKKKKGLPLVEVHPSQDTLTNFFTKGNDKKRFSTDSNVKLQAVKEEEEEEGEEGEEGEEEDTSDKENHNPSQYATEGEEELPRVKRQCLSQPVEAGIKERVRQTPMGPVARLARESESETNSRASSIDVDDPVTINMLEEQLAADAAFASSKSPTTEQSPSKQPSPPSPQLPSRLPTPPCPDPAPMGRVHLRDGPAAPPRAPVDAGNTPRWHSRAPVAVNGVAPEGVEGTKEALSAPIVSAAALLKPQKQQSAKIHEIAQRSELPTVQVPPVIGARPVGGYQGERAFKKPTSPYIPAARARQKTISPAMAPPTLHPRFKAPATVQSGNVQGPKFLPRHMQTPPVRRHKPALPAGSHISGQQTTSAGQLPPTPTQLFLETHIDEFPTLSQEQRELSADVLPDLRSSGAKPSPAIRPVRTVPPALKAAIVKQESMTASLGQESLPARNPSVSKQAMPFFSTQDLFMSSQDIKELNTPTKVRGGAFKAPRPVSATRPFPPEVQRRPSIGASAAMRPQRTSITTPRNAAMALHCSITSSHESVQPATDKKPLPPVDVPGRKMEMGPRYPHESRKTPPLHQCQSPRPDPQDLLSRTGSHIRPQHSTPSSAKASPKVLPSDAEKPAQPSSPPKRRFFTSSGIGADVLLALERSRREYEREQRAHEQEQRQRSEEVKLQLDKARNGELQRDTTKVEEDLLGGDLDDFDQADLLDAVESVARQGPTAHDAQRSQQPLLLTTPTNEQNERRVSTQQRMDTAIELQHVSQETDYGDFEVPVEDVMDLLAEGSWIVDNLDDSI